MNTYQYNYRLGLLIQRDSLIDVIRKQDLVSYYSEPPVKTFDPIPLTDYTLKAFGFRKSKKRYKGYFYYTCMDLALLRRPFTDKFFISNIPSSPDMKYLHELQDFLSYHYPFNITEKVRFADFVHEYGSRKISMLDV